MITQKRLKECLEYDPTTGLFVWKIYKSARARPSYKAGTNMKDGYVHIVIDRRSYYAHRLAWLYVTGEWPPHFIDHINCVKDDNRFANLRLATRAQNEINKRKKSNSLTHLKGIVFHKQTSKWRARIKANGQQISLGLFTTPEEAHEAYCTAAKQIHGNFARSA